MANSDRATDSNLTIVTTRGPSAPKEGEEGSCLVVIYGNDLGRRIGLEQKATTVGRSSKADLFIDDDSISRKHCELTWDGKRHRVRDLESTNGTYVNDELVDSAELRHGDQIKIGRTIMKFISGGNVEGQYHEEIYRLMTVDGLTQVHNKRYFDEVLEREVSRSARYGVRFSIILFDIDHFKEVNDSRGHLAGDAVLRQLGTLVNANIRRDDVVCRTGGEEFTIVTPETDRKGAIGLAEKIRRLVEKTRFEFEKERVPVTISAGVAEWDAAMELGDQLVADADAKLYEAKGGGRNRVCG